MVSNALRSPAEAAELSHAAGLPAEPRVAGPAILLDIDGVLHAYGALDHFEPSCMRALRTIYEATGTSFVLSSSWQSSKASHPQRVGPLPNHYGARSNNSPGRGLSQLVTSTRHVHGVNPKPVESPVTKSRRLHGRGASPPTLASCLALACRARLRLWMRSSRGGDCLALSLTRCPGRRTSPAPASRRARTRLPRGCGRRSCSGRGWHSTTCELPSIM